MLDAAKGSWQKRRIAEWNIGNKEETEYEVMEVNACLALI